jgi:hypothetical protein
MVVTAITTTNGTETRKNHKHQVTLTPSMEALNYRAVGMSLEELNVADVYESLVDSPEKFQEVCEVASLLIVVTSGFCKQYSFRSRSEHITAKRFIRRLLANYFDWTFREVLCSNVPL